ncbi:MAG: hypothetical protein QOI80_1776 [Solirubrobacteraceae bacterium]|nr:hypothetical protein [Solirubrobacteraceae bacterium]
MTETLPQLLERRRGIPQRTTWLVAAGIVVAGALAYLLFVRDPLDGQQQVVHRGRPVFNVLLTPGVVRRVRPRDGELLRLVAHRGRVRATETVRPLRLPAYEGDVAGVLPVFADGHARRLGARLPGFRQTFDGKTPIHTAPGYRIGFTYGTPADPGTGADILLVPPESPGVRDGVILSLRIARPSGRLPPRQRRALTAIRVAFRSFEFGPGRL